MCNPLQGQTIPTIFAKPSLSSYLATDSSSRGLPRQELRDSLTLGGVDPELFNAR